MTTSEHRPHGHARRVAVGEGFWWVVAAAPAAFGSSLLTLASVRLGRWAALFALVWAASAVVLLTRVGERVVVRVAYGFRPPSPAQAVALQRAWATALQVTGTVVGDVVLYVQTARVPNAYAAGGHSIALTSRAVEDYESGRLLENQLVAVLVHELGHRATGATRQRLLMLWLASPWRVARNLLIDLSSNLAGRRSRRGALIAWGRRADRRGDQGTAPGSLDARESAGLPRPAGGALSSSRRRDQPAGRVRRRSLCCRPWARGGAGRRPPRPGRRPGRDLRLVAATPGLSSDLGPAHPRSPRGDWRSIKRRRQRISGFQIAPTGE